MSARLVPSPLGGHFQVAFLLFRPGTEHQGGGDGAHKKRNSTGSVLLGPELEKAHGVRVCPLPQSSSHLK